MVTLTMLGCETNHCLDLKDKHDDLKCNWVKQILLPLLLVKFVFISDLGVKLLFTYALAKNVKSYSNF